MGLGQRPYIGSWRLGTQKVVQHTPDALVYINGDLSLPGCPRCNGKIDFQQFLTEVSVDAATNTGGSQASFTLSIPVHHNESFARDAQYILRPGLEVHVYERGYFAVKGLYSNLDQPQSEVQYQASGQEVVASGQMTDAEAPDSTTLTREQLDDWASQLGVSEGALLAAIIMNTESGDTTERAYICNSLFNRAAKRSDGDVWAAGVGENATTTGTQAGRPYGSSRIPEGEELTKLLKQVEGVLETRAESGESGKGAYSYFHTQAQIKNHQSNPGSNSSPEQLMVSWETSRQTNPGDNLGFDRNRIVVFVLRNPPGRRQVQEQARELQKPEGGTREEQARSSSPSGNKIIGGSGDQSASLSNLGLAGQDIENILAYPYYVVFHGVISSVSVSYSGGVQTVTVQCASMLRFWEYQRISTNASYFGARPVNSGNRTNLIGHNYTGMHPYEIIYKLHQDVAGAAAGVSWALSQKTNIDAKSSVLKEDLYSLNLRYWQKRFQGRQIRLRMHGADGRLFNAAQAAFLGSTSSANLLALTANRFKKGSNFPTQIARQAAAVGLGNENLYNAMSVNAPSNQGNDASFQINLAEMQSFVLDIGSMGQPNLFESTYASKLDLVNEVCSVTGFEFYQDVDGDFVFKPPFYNMDTSSSRVYCIEDIDIIQITFNEGEPAATYITGKNAGFHNLTGTGVENEWGVQGTYIDYRLVAQFGWIPADFETSYLNDRKAIFFAGVSRLDILNIGMHSGSITIPLRPEMRPGYPIYIRFADCFYYCPSFSHSFSVGGQCQTQLEIVGRRAKFYAPGDPSARGIEAIDLGNTTLPQRPLEILSSFGTPKLSGFPNVVMALDPNKLNPMIFLARADFGNLTNEETLNSLIQTAVDMNILSTVDDQPGVYKWAEGEGQDTLFYFKPHEMYATSEGVVKKPKGSIDLREAAAQYTTMAAMEVNEKNKKKQENNANYQLILTLIQKMSEGYIQRQVGTGDAIADLNSSASLLALLSEKKAIFTNGSLPGTYRYYSASHPDPQQQGQSEFSLDLASSLENAALSQNNSFLDSKYKMYSILQYAPDVAKTFPAGTAEPEAQLVEGIAERGVCVYTSNPEAPGGEILPTSEIMELMFARHLIADKAPKNSVVNIPDVSDDSSLKEDWEKSAKTVASDSDADTLKTQSVQDVFNDWYVERKNEVDVVVALTQADEEDIFGSSGKVPDLKFPAFPEVLYLRGEPISTTEIIGDGSYRIGGTGASESAPELFPGSAGCQLTQVFEQLGEALGRQIALKVLTEVTQTWIPSIASAYSGEGAKVRQLASSFYSNLCGRPGGPDRQQNNRRVKRRKAISSPVFPVSDAKGYEVIGSYRYGRGVTIDPDGVFDVLHRQDPLQMLDKRTVDNLVRVFIMNKDIEVPGEPIPGQKTPTGAQAYGPSRKVSGVAARTALEEEILTQLRNQLTDRQILDLRLAIQTGDPNVLQMNLANWFAEKGRDGIQKIPVINAAYSLADLSGQTSQTICSCKMAEAEVLLEASGQNNFVQYAEPGVLVPSGITNETQDRPTQWAISMAAQSSVGWKLYQDALRGTTQQQPGSSIVQAALNVGGDAWQRRLDDLNVQGQNLVDQASALQTQAENIGPEEET